MLLQPSAEERLQKVIARSGISSRRQAELFIKQGRVTVNGKTVTVMGTCVDPKRDHIKVNSRHLKPPPPDVFLMVHKPAGYVSTMKDPEGRPTIGNLLDRTSVRTFPVGRLDYDSEGLVLLTNHGAIAQACLHPRFHVEKTYLVKIKGQLSDDAITQLEHGLTLDDGPTAPARVRKVRKVAVNSWIELTIHEGRNHQVKRMLQAVGHHVLKLKRTKFGPLNLGNLSVGNSRHLTDREANALRDLLEAPREPQKTTQPKKKALWAKRTKKRSTRPHETKSGQQNRIKKSHV
ncbi:MAG: pseudouridine synthase [Nitrospirales bacterium]|nr:MAG: pseudouridine synthase [Nitrospirales bacterium]